MSYFFEAHVWRFSKILSREVCRKCGLIRSRNDFTDWCVKHGCNHEEHPGYQAQRNKAGRKL